MSEKEMDKGCDISIEYTNTRAHRSGNGSLAGPYATLVFMEYRKISQEVACKMVYIDLPVDTDCIEEYSSALYITGKPERFPTTIHRKNNR